MARNELVILQVSSGPERYDVVNGRAALMTDRDFDDAKDYVQRVRTDEQVFLVELDGYRTNLTKEFDRRRRPR